MYQIAIMCCCNLHLHLYVNSLLFIHTSLCVCVCVCVCVCLFCDGRFQKYNNSNDILNQLTMYNSTASSRSNSPMIKKRNQFQSEQTPSSTDTTSREYWLASQPSIIHGHTNLYSQVYMSSLCVCVCGLSLVHWSSFGRQHLTTSILLILVITFIMCIITCT